MYVSREEYVEYVNHYFTYSQLATQSPHTPSQSKHDSRHMTRTRNEAAWGCGMHCSCTVQRACVRVYARSSPAPSAPRRAVREAQARAEGRQEREPEEGAEEQIQGQVREAL